MAKIIRTIIDETGDIISDLSGFFGDECAQEEERFRQDLAQYGLILSTHGLHKESVGTTSSQGDVHKRFLSNSPF